MKKYTIEEKQILLSAMDHYIDGCNHARNILTGEDKDKLIQKLWKIQELRAELIFDIQPITIEPLSPSNADYAFCCLCGESDVLNYPEMRGIISGYGQVCKKCFEKHSPELYKEACKKTQKERKEVEDYYRKEYPDSFNPDGTFKEGELINSEDSLPF